MVDPWDQISFSLEIQGLNGWKKKLKIKMAQ
jgi:hypothetical protein